MQDIRVAAVSMNGGLGEVERVLADMDGWCAQAAAQKADLILFPELLIHGHCTPTTWDLAEPVPGGPSTERVHAMAKKHGLYVSVGLSEKEADIVYNTQMIVGPGGYVGKQRKLHCSRDEVLYYKGGRDFPVLDIGKCKVGMIICYDNQFPEPARILALRGAEVLLMPHAARIEMWDDTPQSQAAARAASFATYSGYATRARENACFVVLADQVGRAGTIDMYPPDSPAQPHHAGGAVAFAPDSSLLASTQREEIREEMIVVDLEASKLNHERSLSNYTLRTRRPEIYGDLVAEQVSC
jgi:predicted amidohydrolase